MKKIKRLLSIPEPHRSGMVFRTLMASYPKLLQIRSDSIERKFNKLASQKSAGASGQRYVATLTHFTAGIGHALSEYNTGLVLAQSLKLQFLHSRLPDPWENFLGFYRGFPSFEKFLKKEKPLVVRLPYVDWRKHDVTEVLRERIESISSERPIIFVPFTGQTVYNQHIAGSTLSH